MSNKYTALCGLYCLDCIPSNEKLFSTIKELDTILSDVQFEKYAALKSQANPVYNDYTKFVEVMQEIAGLECIAPCTEGGCKANCQIIECVKSRKLAGCWECADSPECELLAPLKKIHPNLEYHLGLINKYGTEDWIDKRSFHYWWQSE